MRWIVEPDHESLSHFAAGVLLDQVRDVPESRLGLPTGSTPARMYEIAARRCRERYLCFAHVETWNLDEYVGIDSSHPSSYRTYMREKFFRHVDIDLDRTHIPSGDPAILQKRFPAATFDEALLLECQRYEGLVREAPLDLTILGVGRNGHIGFNEPGTPFDSPTHVVLLDESTRIANAPWFPDGCVPERAITMGPSTILTSRRILLLASGSSKREVVEKLREGVVDESIPASVLHRHDDVTVVVDIEAAGESAQ